MVLSKKAAAVVVAGLMTVAPIMPALAAQTDEGAIDTPVVGEYANPEYTNHVRGESTGDTQLYIIGQQDALTRPEGAVDENLKVSIPVAIHYVADAKGNLVGPSDNTVAFVNHTDMGPVHVSKIAVQNAGDARIKLNADVAANDEMSFYVTPNQGQWDDTQADGHKFVDGAATEAPTGGYAEGTHDELGNYVRATANDDGFYFADKTKAYDAVGLTHDKAINPEHPDEWNIAQKNGALSLNGLTGKIYGFENVDPSTDYQAGTVHWTVRAGTRAAADAKDSKVTIHFNSNNGANKDCVPVANQAVIVLNTTALPAREALAAGMSTDVTAGAGVEAPKSYTQADGSVVTYKFRGWNTRADGNGTYVTQTTYTNFEDATGTSAGTIANLYNADLVGSYDSSDDADHKASKLAGNTYELYAQFYRYIDGVQA